MIRVRQVKIKVEDFNLDTLRKKMEHKFNVNNIEVMNIIRESIDARKKDEIYYVFEVDIDFPNCHKFIDGINIIESPNMEYIYTPLGTKELNKIVIVGTGPGGLFAAYSLLRQGYKVTLIERGEDVDNRLKSIEKFHEENILDEESNVQFGEGGAGTFSDGKLNTLVKDENNRGRFVFNTFVECGANPDILYNFHPHIGTDKLQIVIKNLRNKIISLGGEVLFKTKLTNINVLNNKLESIEVNNKDIIKCDVLVLAIGNSARDTFYMLNKINLDMESKPFAVGIRCIHKQDMINESQHGKKYKDILPPATYKLTYHASNNHGVYSFCMCPGGYVVNASSEENHLAINGMSYSKRDGENANSAIVVTVSENDYGNSLFAGVEFQKELEHKAYDIGNSYIPLETLKDYINNNIPKKLGSITPTIKGKYSLANLNEIFPNFINEAIKEAFRNYESKIKGFASDDVIVAAVESRTSCPIRIKRNSLFESNIEGIYPCGEGAGYSGGITTSAIDGIKVSEAIMNKYTKPKV